MASDVFALLADKLDPIEKSREPGSSDAERTPEAIRTAAKAFVQWPFGFVMSSEGFFYCIKDNAPPVFLSGRFDLLGHSRDSIGGSWGLVIRFQDRDNVTKTAVLGMAELTSDGAAARQRLAALGLVLGGTKAAKERFLEALCGVRTDARVRLIERSGWSDDLGFFATPGRAYGTVEEIVFDGQTRAAHFGERGTLDGWQAWVATGICRHDRLLFSVACAFVGPLLALVGAEPAIWHWRGRSSSGKSTALVAAASVWGEPRFVGSWRGTANSFEGVAALHSDLLLVLDELGVADARSVGDSVYALANGTGKARMASDGSLKTVRRWRTNVISSGEMGLEEKLAEAGLKPPAAGQSVRFIEMAINPSRSLGIFDGEGTKEHGAAMADAIKRGAADSYGTAGPAFLEKLTADPKGAAAKICGDISRFTEAHVVQGADGQIRRVANKFALVAAVGDLAQDWDILPCFEYGDVSKAAGRLFGAWLESRGGIGSLEDREAVVRVLSFLLQHQSARLPPLVAPSDDAAFGMKSSFRAQMIAGYQDSSSFYLSDAGFKEALAGLDPAAAAEALIREGYLIRGELGRRKTKVVTPNGRPRLYKISKAIMEFDDGK